MEATVNSNKKNNSFPAQLKMNNSTNYHGNVFYRQHGLVADHYSKNQ